jgi:hypothetical protein
VAVGLLVLVVTALVQFGLRPLAQAYESRRSTLASLARQADALERIAASREAVERRLQRARQRQELEGFAFRAANASRAAGQLQQHVTQAVTTAGGRVSSIQVLPGEEHDGIFHMTARVTVSTDTETLAAVLHALESSMPWLIVQKLGITSRAGRYRRSSPWTWPHSSWSTPRRCSDAHRDPLGAGGAVLAAGGARSRAPRAAVGRAGGRPPCH